MLVNCQSICPMEKRMTLVHLCNSNSVALVFLTETWLHDEITDSEVFIGSSYRTIARTDRSRGEHGGLLIAHSSNIPIRAIDITIEEFGFAIACVILSDVPSFFIFVYNPPYYSSKYSVVISELVRCMEAYYKKFVDILLQFGYTGTHNVYILGDFNFPNVDWKSYSSTSSMERYFLDFILEKDLVQMVHEPTHKNQNILDLVFCDSQCLALSISPVLFSDHYPIYFDFASSVSSNSYKNVFSRSSFNVISFNGCLQPLFNLISFDNIPNSQYPEEWYLILSSSLNSSIATKRAKRLSLPLYYSSHTIHLLNTRDTTLRKLSKYSSFLQATKLKEITTAISDSIELDKQLFVNQFDLSSSRLCFKLLRNLGFGKTLPSVMFHKTKALNSDHEKSSEFNSYFASVFNEKEDHQFPETFDNPSIKLDDFQLSVSDVEDLLRKCPDSSACGADNIPSFVLSSCSVILAPLAFDLLNWIIRNRTWPSQWKTSLVTPLHKSGNHSDITNYRPISILPKLSLVLERLLFNFIYPRISRMIKREQHGFMKSRSTVSQMISYLDSVYASCDCDSYAVAVYFDVTKAFDSVSHHLLLSKLEKFSFDRNFLDLFNSYLFGRYQSVRINQSISSALPVTSGVPQGSVLGPLLFLCFINDIGDGIQDSQFRLFADDLKVFNNFNAQSVQADINSLTEWSELNNLDFHPKKCKVIDFSRKNKSDQLMLGCNPLPFVEEMDDLGFIISNHLSWK